MLGFDALAGAPLAAGPAPSTTPAPPVDDLVGGDILLVPGRLTILAVEARTTVVVVPARPTILEVRRGR